MSNASATGSGLGGEKEKEEHDVNQRLQQCLITPSLSSVKAKRCFENPELLLSRVSTEIDQLLHTKSHDLCLCLRQTKCSCSNKSECQCDSDFAVDVSTAHFTAHSNCRYSIELTVKQPIHCLDWPVDKVLRLFSLARDDKQTEQPILDIASRQWSWMGHKKGLHMQKGPSYGTSASYGTVFVHPIASADAKGAAFELLDYVQVSERSILVNFDYMSFS